MSPSYEGSEMRWAELGHFNFRAETELTTDSTLQMFTYKLQINYYFQMLLLQMKMCKKFKSGWL